jgi:hypothetical protein
MALQRGARLGSPIEEEACSGRGSLQRSEPEALAVAPRARSYRATAIVAVVLRRWRIRRWHRG